MPYIDDSVLPKDQPCPALPFSYGSTLISFLFFDSLVVGLMPVSARTVRLLVETLTVPTFCYLYRYVYGPCVRQHVLCPYISFFAVSCLICVSYTNSRCSQMCHDAFGRIDNEDPFAERPPGSVWTVRCFVDDDE
jgi:hypothetical protein